MQAGSLLTLLDNEQRTRDEARARVAALLRQTEQAQTQAEQLLQYRAEYEARWAGQFRQRGGIELVQVYQGFMQRLGQAIAQQQAQVQAVQQHLDAARAHLADCELRVASVDKLIERRLTEQQRVARRQEQRNTDEAAARARHGAAHQPNSLNARPA